MKKLLLFAFIFSSFTSFGQFLNYTNINGRYKWIAGKFDSTFTLPSGTTPSLRTGGGNAPGALFYNTADSTVYEYTGSQWRPLHGSDTSKVQIAYVRNTSGSSMTTGQVVYINGSTGNVPTIALANNKNDSSSAVTFGIVRGNMANNGFGWITTFGPIDGINTNAYTEGESIYLDSISGQFTHTKPVAPYHMVVVGYVIKKAGNGIVFVKIQNGYELEELHNVKITAPVLNKSVLVYDSIKALWVDSTVSAAGLGLGGSGTTNYVSKWTSSSALGNSLIFDNGTSVGIGTATPTSTYILDANGVIRGTSFVSSNKAFRFNDLGTQGQFASDGSNTYIDYVGRINFRPGGGGTVMGLTAAGRLLIGTTTESTYSLDVVGTFRSTLDANINGLTVGKGGGSVASNTAFGINAIAATATGTWNTGLGYEAGKQLTSGLENTFVGFRSGVAISTGNYNTSVGGESLFTGNTTGSNAFGYLSLNAATGNYNSGFGYAAGYQITTGTYNTILGSGSGYGITTGSYNTIIGGQVTGLSSSLSNTIILADGQGNQRLVAFNDGNVYIGGTTSLPTNSGYKLDVNGTARVSGEITGQNPYTAGGSFALRLRNAAFGDDVTSGSGAIQLRGTSTENTSIAISNGGSSKGTLSFHRDGRMEPNFPGGYLFYENSSERFRLIGEAVFNEIGANYNFRIEGDTEPNLFFVKASTDNIGIGTTSPNASALLDVSSTTKGFLPPRMTGLQAEAISSPAVGLLVYCNNGNGTTITSTGWWGYETAGWVKLN